MSLCSFYSTPITERKICDHLKKKKKNLLWPHCKISVLKPSSLRAYYSENFVVYMQIQEDLGADGDLSFQVD